MCNQVQVWPLLGWILHEFCHFFKSNWPNPTVQKVPDPAPDPHQWLTGWKIPSRWSHYFFHDDLNWLIIIWLCGRPVSCAAGELRGGAGGGLAVPGRVRVPAARAPGGRGRAPPTTSRPLATHAQADESQHARHQPLPVIKIRLFMFHYYSVLYKYDTGTLYITNYLISDKCKKIDERNTFACASVRRTRHGTKYFLIVVYLKFFAVHKRMFKKQIIFSPRKFCISFV